MNIHEYQAKEVLRGFGVATGKGIAAFTVDEAVKAARNAGRPRLGREGADPRRRPRQGRRRQGGEVGRRGEGRGHAHAGHDAGHPPDRARGQARAAPLHRGRPRDRARALSLDRWSTAQPRASPSSPRPKAAWTSRRWPHDTPEKIITVQVDPAAGYAPYVGRRIAAALKLEGDQVEAVREDDRPALQGLRRQGHEPARDQPAGRHQGRQPDLPRRQDQLRRQRALPPPGDQGTARPHRGGPEGDRGLEVRPHLRGARRLRSAAW